MCVCNAITVESLKFILECRSMFRVFRSGSYIKAIESQEQKHSYWYCISVGVTWYVLSLEYSRMVCSCIS